MVEIAESWGFGNPNRLINVFFLFKPLDVEKLNVVVFWPKISLIFNPIVDKGFIIVNLGMVQNHVGKRVGKGQNLEVGPSEPHRARLHKQWLVGEHFSQLTNIRLILMGPSPTRAHLESHGMRGIERSKCD